MWPAHRPYGGRGKVLVPWVACALAFSLSITGSTDALAYVLVTGDTGEAIHWADPCQKWWLQDRGSEDVFREEVEATTRDALMEWSSVEGTSLSLELSGETCLERHGAQGWPGPHNVIMWRDDPGTWSYSSLMIAVTSVTYDRSTSIIVDADIEMNGEHYRFGTTGAAGEVDLQQALLHELGHSIGLDHSTETTAVMHAKGRPGDAQKRELTDDDRAGVVESHPFRSPSETCESRVWPEADSPYCPQEPVMNAGAGCSGSTPGPPSDWGLLFIAAALLLMHPRRHRRSVTLLGSVVPLLLATTSAHAGEIYKTPNGVPLHWLDDEVSLVLDPDVPESVAEDLAQTFEQAIKPWNDLSCVSTSLVIEGVESCPGEIVDDGVNCVVWVDKPELWRWPSHLVGITLVHFEGDTGRIIDTDMEFNGAFTTWSTGTECTDEHHDLWATVTHEVGHLLGLDHSNRPQATMNAVTFPGDCKKRTLHEDDEETVCGLYAGIPYVTDGGSSATDGGNSGSGDASSAGGGDSGGEGNSVGCGATPGDSGPLWAMVIGAGWLASHRRRRRPSPYRAR